MAKRSSNKNSKTNKNLKKKKILMWSGLCGAIVVCACIVVAVIVSNAKPKTVELTSSQEIAVSSVRLEVAISRLRGGGSITKTTCETFRELAKAFDKNTDWFDGGYCNYYIYADYNDTENTRVVTFSDGIHAAVYTFDGGDKKLLDFKFIESDKKGRFISVDN